MVEEEYGVICMKCGDFIPEPEDTKLRVAKREHLEEEHNVWWHEAARREDDGRVRKI